jgi:chromosome segregation ATPase
VKTLSTTKAAAEERIKKAEETHKAELASLQQKMDATAKKAAEEAKRVSEAAEQRFSKDIKAATEKASAQQQQVQNQLQALEKQMRSTTEQLAQEKKQHSDAQTKLKSLEQILRKAGEDHAAEMARVKAAHEKQTKQFHQELQLASQRSQKDATETVGLQQQVARLNEQHSVAQKQVRHLEGLVQGLEGEKKKLREQLDSLSGNAHSEKGVMTKQLEALGAKLGRTQDECRNLSAQVEQLRQGTAKEAEEKKQLIERSKQDQAMLQKLNTDLVQLKKQSQGLGQQSVQLHAERAAATGQLEEMQKQFKKERDALHQQLSEANSKLSMAAEALRISGQQVAEITSLEQQLRAQDKQREEDRMKIVSMEAQLNQTNSGNRVQIDRANERIQAYERALFDARQTLASKDSRIAELESSVSRLHQAASRASGISPGNNYRTGGGASYGGSFSSPFDTTKTNLAGVVMSPMQGSEGADVGIAHVRVVPNDENVGVFDIPDPSQQYM